MPSTTSPACPRHVPPPQTQLDLEFADLATIDLSKAFTPEGRAELAPQLRDALRTNGFVYVINHGYTQAQRDRIFDIANVPFTAVSREEMKNYTIDANNGGSYAGYKPRKYWQVDSKNDVRDQIEQYAFVNNAITERPHPEAFGPFLPELDAFARHNHFNILHPILRLIALSLELPEETLVEKHSFEKQSGTLMTFMKCHRRTEVEERESKNVWIKGHTDTGSITILWSQPVGGLQILSPDGTWRWVRHVDNALIIDTGDMMEFMTGGFYKPAIHRVVQPPADQRAYDRLSTIYFAMADDNVRLLPLVDSLVLRRVGVERRCPDAQMPLAKAWRKERTISYGRVDLQQGSETNTEEEVVQGIVVKHYN